MRNTSGITPLSIHYFPRAIIHIDGDAFFASCEQSRNPALKGKPVVTGKERGIAASMSYEAKARGVTRGMSVREIKKICPEAFILPSDYETYSLLSKRFFEIVRRFTPEVEEYSIDECFADLTGLQRPMRMSYKIMAEKIKQNLDSELGFTFSVGLGPNKIIAKIASKWKKPSGLTIIPALNAHHYLVELSPEKIWGIGPQTSAYLKKCGIATALDFARKDESWIKAHLTKPHYEIWQELNGKVVLPLETKEKTSYASIQKMRTFSPPSDKREFIYAQLVKNIESACIKARRYNLAASGAIFFLRTQSFNDSGIEVRFSRQTNIPPEIISALEIHFEKLWKPNVLYRSTGVILNQLENGPVKQLNLFEDSAQIISWEKLYRVVDDINKKYGKHKVHLAASTLAHMTTQHDGERGLIPERKTTLLKGETARKRLAIPMWMGEVK